MKPGKIILKYLAGLITLMMLLFLGNQTNAQEQKPNVIFIILDDLNDYEGAFGGHEQAITPNMDRLASSGVQFLNAQSNCPVCMPSRNSLFTGVFPHDSRDFAWTGRSKQPVLKHNKTIMDLCRENGYYMAGTGKLLHNNEKDDWDVWGMKENHNYGPFYFDGETLTGHPSVPMPYREIGPVDGSFGSMDETVSSGPWGVPGWVYGWDEKPLRYIDDNDRDLLQDELHAQWAVQQLEVFAQDELKQPFFLGIGFVKPHTPLHVPGKYFEMYPLEQLELDNWLPGDENDTYYKDNFSDELKGPRYYRTILESFGGDRELAIKKFLQAYLACVTFADEQIGKVLDGLENSPFAENTIVILTSDHGWQMGEKSYLFKNSAWEESVRVPLLIKSPEHTPGQVEHPVSLIDIFPTLIDYCGLEGPTIMNELGGALGGHSLVPFLENPETDAWEGPDGALTIIGNVGPNSGLGDQTYSLRTIDWRYVLYPDGSEELYDHTRDAREWHNEAYNADHHVTKKALRQQLVEMLPDQDSVIIRRF